MGNRWPTAGVALALLGCSRPAVEPASVPATPTAVAAVVEPLARPVAEPAVAHDVDDGTPPLDRAVPANLETATFAMG